MKPKQVKKLLMDEIRKVSHSIERYCINPSKNFTRTRKLPIEKLMLGIIGMESGSITNELLNYFDISPETPTASAFVQQRNKLKPEAFEAVFKGFSDSLCLDDDIDFPMFAIDGSDIQIATNPDDPSTYFSGTNGQKDYNLLHLNALYNLEKHIYVDVVIQNRRDGNEHEAFISMVDKSKIQKALVIADRGYESYNNMAHIQEKGWSFLIRVKDGRTGIKDGLDLPAKGTFDIDIHMKLTRKQTKEVKELLKDHNHYKFLPKNSTFDFLPQSNRKKDPTVFYELNFRVVRFQISDDTYETILTNLDRAKYPPDKIKKLYALRWGIETSFRDLKYTVGMLDFHSKKTACIKQEIYSHLIMYNFAEIVTSQVSIRKKKGKYTYRANFSVAVHICRLYYRNKVTLSQLESIIAKNLIPIRLGRNRNRNLLKKRAYHGFLYRVA